MKRPPGMLREIHAPGADVAAYVTICAVCGKTIHRGAAVRRCGRAWKHPRCSKGVQRRY